jgi:hypothetical protein
MKWKELGFAAAAASLMGAAPLSLIAAPPPPIGEGKVEYALEHAGAGPLAAKLPKVETTYFRNGGRQWRKETGTSVSLHGILPGKGVQLFQLGEHKLAFLLPEGAKSRRTAGAEDVRCEEKRETRTIAGLTARRVDVVDTSDPDNRVTFYLTDRIPPFTKPHHCLSGFPLAYTQTAEGPAGALEIRYTARHVEAGKLSDALFAIPADYRRIEVGSPAEISQEVQKLLGAKPMRKAP